jgi:hypothetical protein
MLASAAIVASRSVQLCIGSDNNEVYMNKYGEQYRGDNSNVSDADSKTAAADKLAQPAAKPAAEAKPLQVQPELKTKGKWPQQVKAAKSQWGKLSEAEILKSDGDAKQLSGLVQQR